MSATAASILGLLAALVNLGRAIITRISLPNARQRAAKAAHDARAASAQGDAKTVNAITERHRIEDALPVLIIGAMLVMGGCSLPRPVVAAAGTGEAATWRVGLAWGQPAAPEINEDALAHGHGASCDIGGCSEK